MINQAENSPPNGGFDRIWLKRIYEIHVAQSRAVGKDGIRPQVFSERIEEECDLIVRKVNAGTYRFTNYREKLIARGAQRYPRQISVPTVRDRLVLRGALEYIKINFPTALPRPPHFYIGEIKSHLKTVRENSSFLRMDIQDFYPSLLHDLIEEKLSSSEIPAPIINIIMNAIKTRTVDTNQPEPKNGIPQGLSISNAIASIYMDEFDKSMNNLSFCRRYVDDIIAIEKSEKIKSAYETLYAGLMDIGLKSHPMGTEGKTEIKILKNGVQYLGYEISDEKISIRASSLSKMFTNLSKVITCFKYKNDRRKHLFRLNLKITGCIINNSRRGWLMFFSQTEDISQISYLDAWLKSEIEKHKIDYNFVKKFKKSFYEIKFNLSDTSYIPNFDNYKIEKKIETISILSNKSIGEIEIMNIESINYEFDRLIGKEVSELERDIADAFS
eukprot:TRINITY_DN53964_c0_g1_i1.p1 TRINITY_DN53964_c0_g1~~TRINITY_DN53964_c0_g1_i1.p1  ORF type:complete len:443 (+),score=26.04 TRINITY_DN53964_c0_g1_i1:792-2120(+)